MSCFKSKANLIKIKSKSSMSKLTKYLNENPNVLPMYRDKNMAEPS